MTDLLMLAIDNHYLPFYRHLTHYLSKPKIREEPVLSPSPPKEGVGLAS